MNADIHLGDCITGMAALSADSVDLCVTSIPFGALFMYSGKPEDVGNNQDGVDMRAGAFGLHMRFFVEQLRRAADATQRVLDLVRQVAHQLLGRLHLVQRALLDRKSVV